jgi:hypothetical protein
MFFSLHNGQSFYFSPPMNFNAPINHCNFICSSSSSNLLNSASRRLKQASANLTRAIIIHVLLRSRSKNQLRLLLLFQDDSASFGAVLGAAAAAA